jgi:hypothetical protein
VPAPPVGFGECNRGRGAGNDRNRGRYERELEAGNKALQVSGFSKKLRYQRNENLVGGKAPRNSRSSNDKNTDTTIGSSRNKTTAAGISQKNTPAS